MSPTVSVMSTKERNEGTLSFKAFLLSTDPKLHKHNLAMVQYPLEPTHEHQRHMCRHVTVADGAKLKIIGNTPEKLGNANIRIIHPRSGDAMHVTTKSRGIRLDTQEYPVIAGGRRLVLEEVHSGLDNIREIHEDAPQETELQDFRVMIKKDVNSDKTKKRLQTRHSGNWKGQYLRTSPSGQ